MPRLAAGRHFVPLHAGHFLPGGSNGVSPGVGTPQKNILFFNMLMEFFRLARALLGDGRTNFSRAGIAMDVFAVRSKNPQQGETLSHDAGSGAAVQGLIATFSDMLRNAGFRMDSDAASLLPKTRAEATASRPEPEAAERPRDSRPERRDDATAAPAERPRRARSGENKTRKDETKPAEESPVSEKADRAKTPASAASDADAPAKPAERAGADRPAEATDTPAAKPAGDETTAVADPAAPRDDTATALGQMIETLTATPAEAATLPNPAEAVAGIVGRKMLAQNAPAGTDPATAADTVSAADTLVHRGSRPPAQGKTANDAGWPPP